MKKLMLSIAALMIPAFSLSLRADSILTTINVGPASTGIAANPVTNKVYVALDDNLGEIAVIDGRTQQVTAKIVIGRFATQVAVNIFTNRVYASGCGPDACNIAVINGKTDRLIKKIPVNSKSFIGFQGLAVNPVTNRIYASDFDNSQLIVINGRNKKIIAQVPVPGQPEGIGIDPKTNHLFIGNGGFPGAVLVYDGRTNTELSSVSEPSSVSQVSDDFRLARVFATIPDSLGENFLSIIDTATNAEITEVSLGIGTFSIALDVNLINHKVYVANGNAQSVTIIDGNTGDVLQTLSVPAVRPDGVAVDLANGLVYVTDFLSNNVTVLQPN